MTNATLRQRLAATIEALSIAELTMETIVLAWDCDVCQTVMNDVNGETQPKCTKCGYTWEQKCERWP